MNHFSSKSSVSPLSQALPTENDRQRAKMFSGEATALICATQTPSLARHKGLLKQKNKTKIMVLQAVSAPLPPALLSPKQGAASPSSTQGTAAPASLPSGSGAFQQETLDKTNLVFCSGDTKF